MINLKIVVLEGIYQNICTSQGGKIWNYENVYFLMEVEMESQATFWILTKHALHMLINHRKNSSWEVENKLKN